MNKTYYFMITACVVVLATLHANAAETMEKKKFDWVIDHFADVKIMRYEVTGFDALSLNQKLLVYYLSQAAIEGRDVIFDQNNRYNLLVRSTLEAVYVNYKGDVENKDYQAMVEYLKCVWFSNGIHHHYSMDKFEPGFSQTFFTSEFDKLNADQLPILKDRTKEEVSRILSKVIFDNGYMSKRVNQADGDDLIATSANNYYGQGISQAEVERYYGKRKAVDDEMPVSYGLNSKLIKANGKLEEQVYKIGGLYGESIIQIVKWLKLALDVTENDQQKKVIQHLINYYETGDLNEFDVYNIAWLNDTTSNIDFINGFIETYGDALGLKASWESVVNFKDVKASERTQIISENAQWFEDHSPVNQEFKKKQVKGVSAKVITAAMLGGDCYPATPIGINLPNSDWIRKQHGSKSVTIENITRAYDQAKQGDGFLEEFAYSEEELTKARAYGFMTGNLHTDLHECLGHGSGQLLPGVKGDELKAYGATIEEARADLFGLYFMMDERLVQLGLLPNLTAAEAEYDAYIRNGLMTQLIRIVPGNDIEESHMRNRQLIAKWVFEQGRNEKVISEEKKDGKTYYVIHDYQALRALFGKLLAEIQRIKSEGDFSGAQALVENYAVKVDIALNKEVQGRYRKLHLAPYGGFVNPQYGVVKKGDTVVDVTVHYTESYIDQMLRYSKEHAWLPVQL